MKILVTGDMHLDGVKIPKCRTDDYQATQIRKLKFIQEIKENNDAVHIDCGDSSDVAVGNSPSDAIIRANFLLDNLTSFLGISGNHDVYGKNPDNLDKSIVGVLANRGILKELRYSKYGAVVIDDVAIYGFPYGEDICEVPEGENEDKIRIAVYHGFVSQKKDKHVSGIIAKNILKEFGSSFQWVLTGDNHTPFIEEYNGSTLINVGSLLRTTTKQKNYKPHITLIDTDKGIYERIPVPIEENVISDEHIIEEEEREERMESFVLYMDEEYDVGLSFEDNMVSYLSSNGERVGNRTKEFINGCTAPEEYIYE